MNKTQALKWLCSDEAAYNSINDPFKLYSNQPLVKDFEFHSVPLMTYVIKATANTLADYDA